MKNKTNIRFFLLAIILVSSLVFFSYSKHTKADNKECMNGKCEQKFQTDFIIWESFSRNFLRAAY
jgi:hypothetical protein